MATLIRESLVDEINQAKDRIDDRKAQGYVKSMHDDIVEQIITNSHLFDKDNTNRKDEVIRGFREAWRHTLDKPLGPFDVGYCQDIVGLLEPALRTGNTMHVMLRDGRVKLDFGNGLQYHPPADRNRVVESLHRMKDAIDKNNLHPVEEAIFTNFHIMRIQPFDNANKRLASILMNSNLLKNGYFPLSFTSPDRELYRVHFKSAVLDFQKTSADAPDNIHAFTHLGTGQTQFYEFLARRELAELRMAEDRLKGVHSYKIHFDPRDKGTMFRAKSAIRGWFYSHGIPYQERLKASAKEMEVIGEIPHFVLDTILSHVKGLGKYRIEDNGKH